MNRLLLLFIFLFFSATALAQQRPDPAVSAPVNDYAKPKNIKVKDEYYDGKGNFVRVIQYDQNNMRVTETIYKPVSKAPILNLHRPISGDTLNKDSVLIVVNKSSYKVDVFYGRKQIRSYIAVFGPRPMENKCVEGDRCTPEGWFKIKSKNPASQYNKFMLLDYPNDSSIARFNALKQKKSIPANARMGGNVGIHGTWKGGEDLVELGVGWTDGCIALKNKDVEELFSFVGVGTRVNIKK